MKSYLLLILMSVGVGVAYAQDDEGNRGAFVRNIPRYDLKSFTGNDYAAYEKRHIAEKKQIPYVHVREADVLWQTTVWRLIDLREKVNMPLYYPTVNVDGRRSLIQVIYDAIKSGDLTAYDSGFKDEFVKRITFEEVEEKLGKKLIIMEVNGIEMPYYNPVKLESVKRFLLKEVWYFDRRYSRMDVRILGLCPIYEGNDGKRFTASLTFWIYFPQLRPFLSEQEVFNTRNDAQRMSFDDLFAQRRFASYVYKQSSVYDNRAILDYAESLDANLESRRIHNELFQKEHDMWEY